MGCLYLHVFLKLQLYLKMQFLPPLMYSDRLNSHIYKKKKFSLYNLLLLVNTTVEVIK